MKYLILHEYRAEFTRLTSHMTIKRSALALAAVALLPLVSCTPYQQQGFGMGALGSAALGALSGNNSSTGARGSTLGSAARTGIAAWQENQRRNQSNVPAYRRNDRYSPQAQQPDYSPQRQQQQTRPPQRENHPFAKRTGNPDIVISPYPPNNAIDISGLSSSDTLARDTSAGKIFRIPR